MTNEKTLAKVELYVISLIPFFLVAIIATLESPTTIIYWFKIKAYSELISHNKVALTFFTLCVLSVGLYLRFRFKLRAGGDKVAKIISIEDKNYEHLSFLATFIIPLSCFNLRDTRSLIIVGLLLIVIGAIYVKTNIFYKNPALALLGYRIYFVEVSDAKNTTQKYTLLSRAKLTENEDIVFRKLDSNIVHGGPGGHSRAKK